MSIMERRKAKKMSRAQLAKECSMTPKTLRLYERGERSPTLSVAARLAVALECTLDDLAEDSDACNAQQQHG